MAPERLADVPATIATFTVDRLAYSLSPPVVAAVIDFEGGGRFQCELTDVDPASVKIGDRVEMTFRRLFTAGGVHNYFWKAPAAPRLIQAPPAYARADRRTRPRGGRRRRARCWTSDPHPGPAPRNVEQRLLRLPLLVDVDPVGLDRVRGHDEVAAAARLPRLGDRAQRRRQELGRAPGRTWIRPETMIMWLTSFRTRRGRASRGTGSPSVTGTPTLQYSTKSDLDTTPPAPPRRRSGSRRFRGSSGYRRRSRPSRARATHAAARRTTRPTA